MALAVAGILPHRQGGRQSLILAYTRDYTHFACGSPNDYHSRQFLWVQSYPLQPGVKWQEYIVALN